jgi:hypothetical protein
MLSLGRGKMKRLELSQGKRVLAAILSTALLVGIALALHGVSSPWILDLHEDSGIVFYSGVLMVVLGKHVVEPWFTKPADVLANTLAASVALWSLSDRTRFAGYAFVFAYVVAMMILALLAIGLREVNDDRWVGIGRRACSVATQLGSSQVMFSVLLLTGLFSYYIRTSQYVVGACVGLYWLLVTHVDPTARVIHLITSRGNSREGATGYRLVGQSIGCVGASRRLVEVTDPMAIRSCPEFGTLVGVEQPEGDTVPGMVCNSRRLAGKRWLDVFVFDNASTNPMQTHTTLPRRRAPGYLPASTNLRVVAAGSESLAQLESSSQARVYNNRDRLLGFVANNSTLDCATIEILPDAPATLAGLSEGVVLETIVNGQSALFQMLGGITRSDHLEEHDAYGYVVGSARQLGHYDPDTRMLTGVPWVSVPYEPVFCAEKLDQEGGQDADPRHSIGHLPHTAYDVPLCDPEALVTHNTAILGILGVGKSCLAMELIQQAADAGVKILCLDVTHEYREALTNYLPGGVIDITGEIQHGIPTSQCTPVDSKNQGGNVGALRDILRKKMDELLTSSSAKAYVVDPEELSVIKQEENAKQRKDGNEWIMYAPFAELTPAEVTRIVCETALQACQAAGLTTSARLWIVFEEAHSLVPEWNSVANDGDKYASSGTARVILQGRKYGLGSLVITQRTANVSKSILNQCNTIFALRIFDDTGKAFLENYVGSDYASVLPTLQERHAVVIGKALGLRRPLIVELNDRAVVVRSPEVEHMST